MQKLLETKPQLFLLRWFLWNWSNYRTTFPRNWINNSLLSFNVTALLTCSVAFECPKSSFPLRGWAPLCVTPTGVLHSSISKWPLCAGHLVRAWLPRLRRQQIGWFRLRLCLSLLRLTSFILFIHHRFLNPRAFGLHMASLFPQPRF